mmetsp:Transcript_130130/g.417572  ORF Transcript_130130/g.417572 Transcript_130130/m.417572 type:complete len:612 (-) Transcript_130130:36-1871(-)
MGLRHPSSAPQLPPSTFFEHTDAAFLQERAAGLEAYLADVLCLEPLPRTRVLRRFLNIWQPLGPGPLSGLGGELGCDGGPLIARGARVNVGVVAHVLAFLEPLWILRRCSKVCRAMHAASRNARCWPSLTFATTRAERWLEPFFTILAPACLQLQQLTLDVAFENPSLAVAPPGGLLFRNLNRLVLRPRDVEAAALVAELLEAVEAPGLREVSLEGVLTDAVLLALANAAGDGLEAVRLVFAPLQPHRPLLLGESSTICLRRLIEATPSLRRLRFEASPQARGKATVSRRLAPLGPPEVLFPGIQPLLADMSALPRLEEVAFDFLTDDVLAGLRALRAAGLPEEDDERLRPKKVILSGVKSLLEDPEIALATVLGKLGENLQEFALLVETEMEMRPFLSGFLHTRIGALPNVWQGRRALQALTLNWTAFDDDGVRSIAEHCPQLHTLLLDRSEYWTDVVADIIVEMLPQLRRFRMRSSAMLSDRCLYILMEVAHRFSMLEIEPSFSMSSYAIDQLKQRISPGVSDFDGGSSSILIPSRGSFFGFGGGSAAGPLAAIEAAADALDPYLGEGIQQAAGAGGLLRLLEPEQDVDVDPWGVLALPSRRPRLEIGR